MSSLLTFVRLLALCVIWSLSHKEKLSKCTRLTFESDSSQRHTHKHAGYDVGSRNTTETLQAGNEQRSDLYRWLGGAAGAVTSHAPFRAMGGSPRIRGGRGEWDRVPLLWCYAVPPLTPSSRLNFVFFYA